MPSLRTLYLLGFLALFGGSAAPAQSPVDAGGWQRVQALPPQTKVHIKSDHRKATCLIAQVTEDGLTCGQTVFPRGEIKSIKLPRRGTSTLEGLLIGGGVGAGVGAGIGAGINSSDKGSFIHVSGGKATGIGAGVGALIGIFAGALVGSGTDFAAHTVYKR